MANHVLKIAFSSCPNDTFMFDAMVNKKIDTEGFDFEYHIADIEELNSQAFQRTFDVTKISFHAFLYLVSDYILLNSGSALGENVGPLLVSKKPYALHQLNELTVGIPGKYTTAAMLLQLLAPQPKQIIPCLFSEIEDKILKEEFDAGLLIHENRFTYEQKGLSKIADLGNLWTEKTQQPIPLGGIVVKRTLPIEIQQSVDRILKRSILFAFQNPKSSLIFVKKHAQAMDFSVMEKHISLYVNEYSKDLSERGRNAIEYLFNLAKEKNMIPNQNLPHLFVEQNS